MERTDADGGGEVSGGGLGHDPAAVETPTFHFDDDAMVVVWGLGCNRSKHEIDVGCEAPRCISNSVLCRFDVVPSPADAVHDSGCFHAGPGWWCA